MAHSCDPEAELGVRRVGLGGIVLYSCIAEYELAKRARASTKEGWYHGRKEPSRTKGQRRDDLGLSLERESAEQGHLGQSHQGTNACMLLSSAVRP